MPIQGIHNDVLEERFIGMIPKDILAKPKIDIRLSTRDINMPPIEKVRSMDEDSFEIFVQEWLFGCRGNEYTKIERLGGAGDKGRDLVASCKNGQEDFYQCKHYSSPLCPSEYYVEFGKLCYYAKNGDYSIPRKYYIVASQDIGPALRDLIESQDLLKKDLKQNWGKYCERKITQKNDVPLDASMMQYIDAFDFSIIEHIPIQQIIDEHIKTIYGKIRFGGEGIALPKLVTPPSEVARDEKEMPYIKELLRAYSEKEKIAFKNVEDLAAYPECKENFNRQRKDYYAIETVERFVRDTFTNDDEFTCLKDEIYDGIIDVHEEKYNNGFERLNADMKQAVTINTQKSLLDSKLKLIGSAQRKGTCHKLVNDNRIKWVKDDQDI